MELPKLYAPVIIKFWSLRYGLGSNMGVTEYDCQVERKCRRVITKDNGWKWQIVNYYPSYIWDSSLEQDKEVLDNYLDSLEFEYS